MSYVFLDRVIDCEPGVRIAAIKALALNEDFFRDHFPGMPVLPGAMVLEGFVQAARRCLAEADDKGPWVLHEVRGMSFNRFATPGEVVRLEIEREADRTGAQVLDRSDGNDRDTVKDGDVRRFKGSARVGDERVCRTRFAVRRAGI